MKNAVNWFEIPVVNFDRAKAFYEAILSAEMMTMEMPGMKSAFFPADLQNGIGGCITQAQGYVPATVGSLIYLNGGEDLGTVLSKVEGAGGKIVLPKTSIGPNGFMAHFEDTEGNKVALHSMK